MFEEFGYLANGNFGDLLSTTFSHGGTSYTVSQVYRSKNSSPDGNTVLTDKLSIAVSSALPDGTVLQLGSRTFTVDSDSETNTPNQEAWDLRGNPLSWTAGQHVTASLKFPTAPNQPTGLTATANGATQIDLAWVAPADNGGATISGYRIEVSADAGTTWTNLLANTGTTNVTYSHTGLTRGSTRHYRVSAINANGTGGASDPTSATTATPTPPAPPEITVPNDWSLIPTGHSTGDKFRLIFLSSTKTNAGSADIVDYNTFIQGRAAGGHSDIQTYSAGFRAVGCTDDSDATANTATTGTGVVIHWLNGNKVADDYTDFYDGSWDEERNNQDRNELGNNGPDTSNINNYPYTGCKHDGTESITGTTSYALGAPGGFVRTGRPNSTASGDGPISSGDTAGNTFTRPMYGLSQVFEVADAGNTATTGTPSIDGTPQVGLVLTAAKGTLADVDGTTKADNGDTGYAYSYQWVRVDGSTETPITSATARTYTLTAADLGKTIKVQTSFTDDGDTAEGPLTSAATVAVLAAAGACPTDNDWCTTLTVEFRQQSPSVQYYGYIENFGTGALGDRTINYGGRNWMLDALFIRDDAGTRTIRIEDFFTNGFLPRGSVFTLGGQDFTTNAAAEDFATKVYEWPVPAGMAWIDGQEVTVSVTLANFAATGEPTISGTAAVGETLTAAIGNIADTDGLPTTFPGDYTFQWLRRDGGTDSTITGATAITYTPVAADVGKKVKVTVSFTDDGGTGEARTSNAYPSSGTISAEPLPELSFAGSNITVSETAGTATLTVELDPASTGTVTVDFATSDVGTFSAHAGVDYTATSGTLTFAASETSKTITVPILNDTDYDPSQRFRVTLSNASGATLPTSPWAFVNITNDDAMPTASIANVTVGEGAGTLTLTLALDRLSNGDITYSAATAGVSGTATVADDYVAFLQGGSKDFNVPAGAMSATFDITLVDDSLDETDETIVIIWDKSSNSDATPTRFTFTGTITDNDTAGVTLSKTSLTVTEEDTTGDSYTVVLTSQPTANVVVTVAGHSGTDVTPTPTTLTFTPINWETVQPVTVTAGTDMDMVNETVSLTHSAASTDANYNGITIGGVAVSVHDDDTGNNLATGKPAISGTAQVGETLTATIGNIADTDGLPATFPGDYTFQWLRVDADGMSNETDIGAGAVTYTPVAADVGKKVKVTVSFTDDGGTGEARTSNAYPSSGTITAEPLPALSFVSNEVTVDEDAGPATLTVELTPASTGTVTVDYATRDSFAKAGEDYTATSGTLTFTAGQTSKTFTVPITDDDVYENNEAFFVDLSNPTGATLPDPPLAAVRIDSGEAAPTASMADVTVDEGAGTMTLTLRLSHPSDAEIAYFTIYDEDIATGTATEGEDYDDFLLGPVRTARITVPAGDLSQTFDITLVDDGVDEPDETIVIEWIRNSNDDATPDFITFTGTITDNDTADNNPTVRFGASSYTAIEGVAGAVVTVELNPAASRAVTILVTATPQGGASSADYSGVPGSVTFAAGETEQSFTVRATDDSAADDGESVQLGFGRLPSGVLLGSPSTATVALVQDADVSTWYVWFGESAYTATEGGTATISVHLNSPWKPERNEALTVPLFDPEHRGGASADDYSGLPESVTFQPGQTRASFTVRVTEDSEDDDGESVLIGFRRLFPEDLEVGRYGPHKTTLRIADNDGEKAVTVSFAAANYTAAEGGATATVRLRLDAAPGRSVTIELTKTHRGATAADYSGLPDNVTFGASETEKSFTVTATDDSQDDDRESVAIGFGSLPSKVSAGSPSEAVVQLTDNDHAVPSVQVRFDASAGAVRDGVEEGGSYRLGVRLSVKPGVTLTIPLKYAYLGGATAADFSNLPANVTFAKNVTSAGVTIRPVDDFEEDPGESLKVSFGTLPAGVSVNPWSGRSTIIPVIDNDATPGLSVSDASAREWPNKKVCLVFVVTMDRMDVDHEVSVDYATRSGTAVAGLDFKPISGTLVFRPAESKRRTASKSLCVEVIDDSHDEGVEEMTLVLSNPVRAYLIDDGTGTGSISNTDKMPGAWLTRFGRAATDHVVEAVGERWQGGPQTPHLTLGGRQAGDLFGWAGLGGLGGRSGRDTAVDRDDPVGTDPSSMGWLAPSGGAGAGIGATVPGMTLGDMNTAPGGAGGVEREAGKTLSGRAAQGALLRALGLPDPRAVPDLRTLLMGSSFFYSAALDEDGESRSSGRTRLPGRIRSPGWLGEWSAWGRTASSRFSGADGSLALDGEVATAMLGFDSRWDRWLAGVVVSFSEGRGAYTHPTASGGAVASTMTGVNPYARFELNDRTSVWGVLGYGAGDLSLTPARSDTALGTELANAMAAFGGRTALSVRTGEAGRFELALRSDARLTNTVSESIEGLVGTAGQTARVRLMLEGSGSMRLATGGVLKPKLEAGLRYDTGDAETGAGLEVGGGLGYAAGRLSVEVNARGLLAHRDTEYEEWGFSGSIAYTPSKDGRGLSMRLGSAWGATQSGVQSLWSRQDASGLVSNAAFEAAQRYQVELRYGLDGKTGRARWEPFVGVESGEGASRALRLGVKLTSGRRLDAGLELGQRQGRPGADPEQAVQLRGALRW